MEAGPKLLIDERRVKENIRKMARKCDIPGLSFRPHFKTHRSIEVARWFRETGVEKITVPSLSMASYFLEDEWKEQTVALPVDPASLEKARELAFHGDLRFIVSEGSPIPRIDQGMLEEVEVMIELETGDARSGLDPEAPERIDELVEELDKSERLSFVGFLTHSGNSYQACGREEILAVHDRAMELIRPLKDRYASHRPIISVGDTPTARWMEDMKDVDEIRPGNFVFYDLMQERIGSCSMEEIALCLSCPVVSKKAEEQELVLHGGALHFSLDRLHMEDGTPFFGKPVRWEGRGWGVPYEGSFIKRLSQEHGVVKASEELYREKEVGDRLAVLPVHSCLCGDGMPHYELLDGTRIGKFRG